MKILRAVYGVLKDLIIGDDWRMIVGVNLLLTLVAAADAAGWVTWWLPPLGAASLLVVGATSDPPRLRRRSE